MGAIFGFTGPPDAALLSRMSRVLAHRGAVGEEALAAPEATLAYRAKHEPPVRERCGAGLYQSGGRAIALAGYLTHIPGETPDPARPRLARLLELYEQRGLDFLDGVRGAFAIALRDGPRLLLARDGAGVRSIYHGRVGGRALFAIEPKGVRAAPGFAARIRPAAVAQYLAFSFVPGGGTMLEGLHELPAGCVAIFEGDAEPKLHRYFSFEEGAPEEFGVDPRGDVPESHWLDLFRREFGRAVEERIPQGEDVAVFLSGGIDSSVVACEAVRRCGPRARTFAVHFGPSYPHELEFARAVAERIGAEHEEILIEPKDFLPRLREIIWQLDDPIGDPVTVPNFELAGRVASRSRWAFNGEGGDPVFGGPKNIPMLLQHWYGGVPRDPAFRERAYLASFRRGYDDLARMLALDWQAMIDPAADLESIITPYFDCERPARFLDKLTAMNIRMKGAHLILPKVDRMAGASGLTTLSPLFDERLMRMSFAMPPSLKLWRGIEKGALKRAYADDLPPQVIARPKSGMRVPVHYWFQGEMKRYAREILSPKRVRAAGIFGADRVRQLLDYNIEEGPGRYGLRLWMLLTFEIWRRIVVEGEPV